MYSVQVTPLDPLAHESQVDPDVMSRSGRIECIVCMALIRSV